jgi:hypothetical protein
MQKKKTKQTYVSTILVQSAFDLWTIWEGKRPASAATVSELQGSFQ